MPIGAGGMGEVYKARDTRLYRLVAIKTSKEQFTERFEREARAVAALNHPNICTLHDVGPNYLVMEYIEGQTLKGPLPLDQVLQYATQICDALDAAHRKGITHRDLKPANILLTKSGIKLLDFGLAKLNRGRAVDAATETIALTKANTILGTLQYMAPEQLEGKEADARCDIFAFGAVLYEMLTGQRAFPGQSQASVIAAILERDAPSVAGAAPARLDRLLRRCLAKNPDDRWQSARDLKFELEGIVEPEATRAATKSRRLLLPWIGACLLAVGAIYGWLLLPSARAPLQLALNAPSGAEFSEYGGAISPDGRLYAFTATKEGKRQIWVRSMDSSAVRPLQGTEDSLYPFWSPDSRSLGFFTNGKLKRVDLGGGVQVLSDAVLGHGGSWSSRGVITFCVAPHSPLFQVPASGGQRTQITHLDSSRQEFTHAWPQFLPDGRHFLYLASSTGPQRSAIFLGTLDAGASPKPVRVVTTDLPAIYVPSTGAGAGWLVFSRDRVLTCQHMDPATGRLDGEPVPVPGLEPLPGPSLPVFLDLSATSTGMLAYRSGPRSSSQIVRRQRTGATVESIAPFDDYTTVALSSDSRRLAVGRAPASGNYDIWLLDLSRRVFTRFTFGPYLNFYPVWSSDGRSIFFTSTVESSAGNLFVKAADGAGDAQAVTQVESIQNSLSWSRDGRFRIYGQMTANNSWDLWIQPTAAGAKPFPFLQSPAMEIHAQFSPDGRWIAYTSDESGADQVYVQAFTGGPATGAKSQVSAGIGRQPRWRGDGRELFYVAGDGKMMAVAVKASSLGLELGAPVPLFDAHLLIAASSARFNYDVTHDGQQFYLLARDENVQSSPVTVLVDWQAGLKK
jgi:serine/threonine protein kinase